MLPYHLDPMASFAPSPKFGKYTDPALWEEIVRVFGSAENYGADNEIGTLRTRNVNSGSSGAGVGLLIPTGDMLLTQNNQLQRKTPNKWPVSTGLCYPGGDVAGKSYWGGVLADNDCAYLTPDGENAPIIKYDPADLSTTICANGELVRSRGAILARNGCVYYAPWYSTAIKKYDPVTDTLTTIGEVPTDPAGCVCVGAVLSPEGNVYFGCGSFNKVIKIHPENDEITYIETGMNLSPQQQGWAGLALHTNGKIYNCPYDYASFYCIDPETDVCQVLNIYCTERPWGIKLTPIGRLMCSAYTTGVNFFLDLKLQVSRPQNNYYNGNYKMPGRVLAMDNTIYGHASANQNSAVQQLFVNAPGRLSNNAYLSAYLNHV